MLSFFDSLKPLQKGEVSLLLGILKMPFYRFKTAVTDHMLNAAGIHRSGFFIHAQSNKHPAENGMPFMDFLCDFIAGFG